MSQTDTAPVAAFPSKPISADLHGTTLTIYWAGGHTERISAPYGGWTRDQMMLALGGYGMVLADVRTTHVTDAFVTAFAGVVAVGERVATGLAHVARAVSDATSVRTARSHG